MANMNEEYCELDGDWELGYVGNMGSSWIRYTSASKTAGDTQILC